MDELLSFWNNTKSSKSLANLGLWSIENWKWHLGLWRQWHLLSSQTDGFNSAVSTLVVTWLAYYLNHHGRLGQWRAYFYSIIPVTICIGVIRLAKVTRILFIAPRLCDAPKHNSTILGEEPVATTQMAVSHEDFFVHRPLGSKAFTRLLLLKPSMRRSARLEGEMIEFPFNVSIYYFAVSYVWGDPTPTESIFISQKRLPITANCGAILKKLRHRFKARLVWIDAICINQQDLAEKELQIQWMKFVYSSAVQTIIWLGDSSDNTSIALDYLRLYSLTLQLPQKIQGWVQGKIIAKIVDRDHLKLFQELAANPWFGRIWTLQEVALARPNRAQMYSGSFQLPWEMGSWALTQISTIAALSSPYTFDETVPSIALTTKAFARMDVSQDSYPWKPEFKLSKLFVRLQSHQATDPRDRIYGLLAIVEEAGINILPSPSYDRTISGLYWETTVRILEHDKGILLLLLHSQPRRGDMNDTPTWVPDFRIPGTARGMMSQSFTATRDSKADFVLFGDHRVLFTMGYKVDTILWVSEKAIWQPGPTTSNTKDSITSNLEEGPEQTILALREWLSVQFIDEYESKYEDKLDAFLQTVMFGKDVSIRARGHHYEWLFALIWTDPRWENLRAELKTDDATDWSLDSEDVASMLHQYAYSDPTLQARFFNEDAPLRHLTGDPMWRLMCLLKTVPGIRDVQHQVSTVMRDSKFFYTDDGYIGTGTINVKPGDTVVLVPGLQMPLMVREVEGHDDQYTLVGTAYVHGFMNGEAWDKLQDGLALRPLRLSLV